MGSQSGSSSSSLSVSASGSSSDSVWGSVSARSSSSESSREEPRLNQTKTIVLAARDRQRFQRAIATGDLEDLKGWLDRLDRFHEKHSLVETPLHLAARAGQTEIVRHLINRGVDLNKPGKRRRTPLHCAAIRGHLGVVKLLLERGALLDPPDASGRTPFHYAAAAAHEPLAMLLFERGAARDAPDAHGRTPLSHAAARGLRALLRSLLNGGAAPDAVDRCGLAPLHRAAISGHKDVVKQLLERGAAVDRASRQGLTPLHYAAYHGYRDLAKILLERGASVDSIDEKGKTPLHHAAQEARAEVVELLLDRGADWKRTDADDLAPLHRAAIGDSCEAVKLLLERGARVDWKNIFGIEPLFRAAAWDCGDVTKFFLKQGAALDRADGTPSPLQFAAACRAVNVAKILLDAGAPVNHVDEYGYSALTLAAISGNLEVVELLLDRGAHVDIVDKFGWTPLHHAIHRANRGVAMLLLDKGAAVDHADRTGRTALHHAVVAGQKNVVQRLLDLGAPPHVVARDGRTPFVHASETGNEKIINLLQNYPSEMTSAQLASTEFLRVTVLRLQYTFMEHAIREWDTQKRSCLVGVEGDIPSEYRLPVTLHYDHPRENYAWIAEMAKRWTPLSKFVLDGFSINLDELMEESMQSVKPPENRYKTMARNLLTRAFEQLIGQQLHLGDCTAVILANGLVGEPDAHIRIADELKKAFEAEDSQLVKIFLEWALPNDHLATKAATGGESEGAGWTESIRRQVLRRVMMKLVLNMKALLWPTVVNPLLSVAAKSRRVFEMAKTLREANKNLKSFYVGAKFFEKEEVLRIMYVRRKSLSCLVASEHMVSMETYPFDSFDNKVSWIDVWKGALLSDVLQEVLKSGISLSDMFKDMATYVHGEEYGCWTQALDYGQDRKDEHRVIVADEPMLLRLQHEELEGLEKRGVVVNDGVELSIYRTKKGVKVDCLGSFGNEEMSVDSVAVLAGLKVPLFFDLIKRCGDYCLKSNTVADHGKYKGVEERAACKLDMPEWEEWFPSYVLCEGKGNLFLVSREARDKLICQNGRKLEAAGGTALPVSGREIRAKVSRGQTAIPADFFECLLEDDKISQIWNSTEQLRGAKIIVPEEWKDKTCREASLLRLWQWLQLAAVQKKARFEGKNQGGLYSHKSPKFVIGNEKPMAMHEMGAIDGRGCKWKQEGNQINISGILSLDGKFDMEFRASYEDVGASSGDSGNLTEASYEGLRDNLRSATAVEVSLTPVDANECTERVFISGTWV